jgi:hypothetical protein
MIERGENGVASPEDFQSAALARGTPERLTLPKSGLKVVLRRPNPMWFLFHGLLPASLAARVEGGRARIESVEDLRTLAGWMVPLLSEVFVEPRLTLDPGPGSISPDLLDLEDATFVIRWAVGEVAADAGGDLASFRDGGKSPSDSSSGRNLALPSK